ncbi:maturation of Asn-linked oligosaccharides protein, partial [Ascosphaera atra]
MHLSPILRSVTLALALSSAVSAMPVKVEELQKTLVFENADKADAVRDAFRFAWDGYYKYAFPHDELRPVSNGSSDSRNGWGASAVDALSTAIIMDLPDVVEDIMKHIDTIDYSQTDQQVSLFETTIRYLGGMLSGYDLLEAGACSSCDRNLKDRLLEQSQNLADVMKFAFNSPTGIPWNNLNITAKTTDGAKTNGIATTGSLVLEWTRLSDLLDDDSYGKLAQKGEEYLLHPKPKSREPFPGLIGSKVSIETGELQDARVSWGGGDDSFYEYLIKMYIYDPKRFEEYKDRWVDAIESSMKHLGSDAAPNVTFLMDWYEGRENKHSGHLNCFDGGNFVLGGQVLKRQDIIDYGLKLVAGCHATYAATTTGIGPESFGWDSSKVPSNQKDFFKKNGFYIDNFSYQLRPEVIESFYYAWRATGDTMYRDWVWDAFVAIRKYARTSSAFTSISNVMDSTGGKKSDFQESFLYAEVLKYCYLTFSEEALPIMAMEIDSYPALDAGLLLKSDKELVAFFRSLSDSETQDHQITSELLRQIHSSVLPPSILAKWLPIALRRGPAVLRQVIADPVSLNSRHIGLSLLHNLNRRKYHHRSRAWEAIGGMAGLKVLLKELSSQDVLRLTRTVVFDSVFSENMPPTEFDVLVKQLVPGKIALGELPIDGKVPKLYEDEEAMVKLVEPREPYDVRLISSINSPIKCPEFCFCIDVLEFARDDIPEPVKRAM